MANSQEETTQNDHIRLSDKVLDALELSLSQGDIQISEQLVNALELSLTRAGGKEFVERRHYPERVEKALDKFHLLKREKGFE